MRLGVNGSNGDCIVPSRRSQHRKNITNDQILLEEPELDDGKGPVYRNNSNFKGYGDRLSEMRRTNTADGLSRNSVLKRNTMLKRQGSELDRGFLQIQRDRSVNEPSDETKKAQAFREVMQFYEDGTPLEIDDLLSRYELESQVTTIAPELTFNTSEILQYIIVKLPEFDRLSINILEINQIVRELTVGIFMYNSLPTVEFLPCQRDLQTARVHVPMPYKDSLIGLILFKLLYKTNLLYHGSRLREETSDTDGKKRKVYSDTFAYRRGTYERYEKQVMTNQVAGISTLKEDTLFDTLHAGCDLLPAKTPPSLSEPTRQFLMQANPQSQPPSQAFLHMLEHHFFELSVRSKIQQDTTSSNNSLLFKVEREDQDPVTLNLINPLPEKIIAPEIFDRFRRIIDYHTKYVTEKLEEIALTPKEKYLLHFSNAVVLILVRLKRRGFRVDIDETFSAEIQNEHGTTGQDINEKIPSKIPPFIAAGPFGFKKIMRGRGRITLGHDLVYKNPEKPLSEIFTIQVTTQAIIQRNHKSVFGTVWFPVVRSTDKTIKSHLLDTHRRYRDERLNKRANALKEGGNQKSKVWTDLRELFDDFTDAFGYDLPALDKFRSEPFFESCRTIVQQGRGLRLFYIMLKLMKPGESSATGDMNKTLLHYCCAYNRPFMLSALLKTAIDFTVGRVSSKTNDIDFSGTAVHEAIRCNGTECFKKIVQINQKRQREGLMKMDVLSLLNYEHHFPVHSIVRHHRTCWFGYFFNDLKRFLSGGEQPGLPTGNHYYLVHLAAQHGCLDYLKNHLRMDREIDLLTGKDKKSALYLAVEYQQMSVLHNFTRDQLKAFFLENITISLPCMVAYNTVLDAPLLQAIAEDLLNTGFSNDILTILANSEYTSRLPDDVALNVMKKLTDDRHWDEKTENSKSKILHVMSDFAISCHARREDYSKEFVGCMEEALLFFVEYAHFTILDTIAQFYHVLAQFFAIPDYDHSRLLRSVVNHDNLAATLQIFYTSVDQREDSVVIACLRFFTATVVLSEPLRSKLVEETIFVDTCVHLLGYQQSDTVCVVTCHFFYAFCNQCRTIQLRLADEPVHLQEKIRPVLRNFKTEVKIAAVRATWSLATGQNKNAQRRVAAKFGIREINRMLMSTPHEQDHSEIRGESQKLQGLGLTILRAYCKHWPSGQIICSEKETLVNIRTLCTRYLKPTEATTNYHILLLKSIRDLLSIDSVFLVNSEVQKRLWDVGIVSKLVDIWKDYKLSFSSEIVLLLLTILNFVNHDQTYKIEVVLNDAIEPLIWDRNFETLISIAHYSVERTSAIQLSWHHDIMPAIELTEPPKVAQINYKQQAALISFIIFCSPRIFDVDSTTAVAVCFKKIHVMLSGHDLKSVKYASKIVTNLPLIGHNYLNALAENGFVELFISALEAIKTNRAEYDLEVEQVECMLASAIATFTVEPAGRRIVLCELRKRPQTISRILQLIQPDRSFWEDVLSSIGADDLSSDLKSLAVPELCISMDSDFIVNLKYLLKRTQSFELGYRRWSRLAATPNSGKREPTPRSKSVMCNYGDSGLANIMGEARRCSSRAPSGMGSRSTSGVRRTGLNRPKRATTTLGNY